MEYSYNIYRKYDNGATGVVGGSVGTPSDATFYANLSLITGDFDCAELAIGCSRVDREDWDGVDNSPNLPTVGIFDVIVGENYKSITYTADTSTQNGCVATKTAELTVVDGVAGDWIYYADNEETYKYGEIALPSAYEKGKALDTSLRTLPAEYTKQYAYLNRGKVLGAIAFNTFYSIGDSYIKFESGSTFAPPTTENEGVLNVRVAGCYIIQTFSPKDSNALFFRERNADKTWTSWYTATAGSMVTEDGKGVYVPTFLNRGIGSGYSLAKVYFADEVDNIANYTAGFGIAISGDKVISWTGTAVPFTANPPLSYSSITGALSLGLLSISQTSGLQAALDSKLSTETDPTVPSWVKVITSTNISNWNTAFGWGNHAGLYPLLSGSYANPTWITSLAYSKITGVPNFAGTYAPLSRQLTVAGTAGRVAVTGGAQSLAADRAWTVDLATVHAGISGGAAKKTPTSVTIDAYGRTTGMVFSDIAFPVTGVSGGVLSLSAGIISLSPSAYDSRYSLLGHSHAWADITGKPSTFAPSAHTHPYTEVTGITAGAGITYISGVIASTITQYTNAMARAAISGTGLLSYNSTTGEMSLNSVPWANVTGAPSFVTQAYATIQSNGTARTQRAVLNFSSEFTAVDNAGSARTDVGISSVDWSKVANAPDFAGLYVPIVRQLTINGTAGRVVVTGGTQNLSSSRTWTIDHETIHAGLSGGSGITTPSVNVDAYGRVTSLVYSTILFPVTSVNGQTGAVSLNTDNIAEGATNLYWTNARGDARYVQLSGSYSNPSFITSLAWAKITGAPSFLTQAYTTVQADTLPVNQRNNLNFSPEFGITDSSANNRTTVAIAAIPFSKLTSLPTTLAGHGITNAYTKTEVDALIPIGYVTSTGTTGYVPKFTGAASIGNSSIFETGGNVAIGSIDPAGYKLLINGAIYSIGDSSGVAMHVPSGRAIRAQGTLNIDAGTAAPIYFRSGGGASYLMELNSSGQIRFNSYYSATQWSGTAAAMLGTDSSGNVITLATVRTNAQNDALYAPISHNHDSLYYTKSQVDSFLGGKANTIHGHNISDVTGLQSALDNRPTFGQLSTSGGGGQVHWNNVISAPSFLTSESDPTVPSHVKLISSWQISNWDAAYSWGRHQDAGYLTSLPPHDHDDRYYTKGQSDSRYLQFETDPKGYSSHWFSVSGSTVTLGIQKVDGGQGYASFNIPSTSSDYSVNWSAFTSGLGHHILNLVKSGGGGNSANLYEQDPKGVNYVTLGYSGGVLTVTIVRRDGTTTSDSVNFSS